MNFVTPSGGLQVPSSLKTWCPCAAAADTEPGAATTAEINDVEIPRTIQLLGMARRAIAFSSRREAGRVSCFFPCLMFGTGGFNAFTRKSDQPACVISNNSAKARAGNSPNARVGNHTAARLADEGFEAVVQVHAAAALRDQPLVSGRLDVPVVNNQVGGVQDGPHPLADQTGRDRGAMGLDSDLAVAVNVRSAQLAGLQRFLGQRHQQRLPDGEVLVAGSWSRADPSVPSVQVPLVDHVPPSAEILTPQS
ncbi:hypothetical protein VMZ64_37780 [Streptomyces noursei]|nr:hypothetical protein [Streptomyces noursei]